MIKKILPLILFLIGTSVLHAQVCDPDESIGAPGVYPEVLPDAYVGVEYNEVIQFKFLKDTVFQGFRIDLDSFLIVEARNMPPGFSYDCNKRRCDYGPQEVGCVRITGTPAKEHVGSDSVEIDVLAYYTVPFTGTVANQKVTDKIGLTITEKTTSIDEYSLAELQLYPNPARDQLNLQFEVHKTSSIYLVVIDMVGKTILNQQITAKAGKNELRLPLTGYSEGLALLSLQTENGSILTKKVRLVR